MKHKICANVKDFKDADSYYKAVVSSCIPELQIFLTGEEIEAEIKQAWVDQVDNVIRVEVLVSFTKSINNFK